MAQKTTKEKREQATNVYTLSPAILDKMIEYIEEREVTFDYEKRHCRELHELIRDNAMPDLYKKLLTIRNSK